jgi:hypothetical protein
MMQSPSAKILNGENSKLRTVASANSAESGCDGQSAAIGASHRGELLGLEPEATHQGAARRFSAGGISYGNGGSGSVISTIAAWIWILFILGVLAFAIKDIFK